MGNNHLCQLLQLSNKGPGFVVSVGLISPPPQTWEGMKRSSMTEKNQWCVLTPKNGLYVTAKHSHGVRLPVHVQKCLPARLYDCEVDECRDFMSIAAQSGNPGKECYHLERTRRAHVYIPPPALNTESLNDMVKKGIMSTSRQEEGMALYQRANTDEADSVFPFFWGEHSLSDRYIFFSMYTDEKDNRCKFGRTISTFDTKSGKWHCQCIGSRNRISCVHTLT